MRLLAKLISTVLFLGYFPVASGTLASALAVVFVLLLRNAPWFVYVGITFLIVVIGIWASQITEEDLKKKDPSCVVIDEVAGILISFFLIPLSWPVVIVGFFLFRAFDMFKIPPADRLEEEGGGRGIMLDDVMAGVYTNIVLHSSIFLSQYLYR